MKNFDVPIHVRGESVFLDDIPEPAGTLHAVVFGSPSAHGVIKKLDLKKAAAMPGVAGILTAPDIPGENQIGAIITDEELLATQTVHFIGEPIALVIAQSKKQAQAAAKRIDVEIQPLPVVIDPRDAYSQGRLVAPERTFLLGDIHAAWAQCHVVVEGRVESGGQEHFYMEPQAAMAVPVEGGGIKLYSSTQSPTGVQRIAARVLGLPMHKIEVDVRRLGGGFGGKEDQATPWAVLAATAAVKLNAPVKLTLNRHEDMVMTGKRHPYSSDFKIGLTRDGSILAYDVKYYQNAGAAADLSTAILERTLFHSTNAYFIPNVRAVAASCYTNLAPNTAFRGFGGPQAMFVMECAILKAARQLNLAPEVIQAKNLLQEGDSFPYGMPVENCRARRSWLELDLRHPFSQLREKAARFNETNRQFKKGTALMPVCFGISFTNTAMNQAGALVHVYTDGSVGVSTAAVEMGQGVNQKILTIAVRTFSISEHRVKLETTNTTRVANTSPTAASSGADLNGKATEIACLKILNRLKTIAADILGSKDPAHVEINGETVYLAGKKTELSWQKLVNDAYWKRTDLSAHGYYSVPRIHFDREQEKGSPFAYHVFGTAAVEITLDCLRGTYDVDAVHIVHDAGRSLNHLIDRGQVEGGLIQGIGWLTMEELNYSTAGRLLTDSTSTYKIPDIKSTPDEVNVHFLEDADNPYAVLSSKAVGEPPFMYGIGVYFAIMDAVKAYRPHLTPLYDAPATPEKILMLLNS